MPYARILGVTWEPWEPGKKGPELLLESIVILTVGPILVNPLRCRLRPLPTDASAGVTWWRSGQ